MSASKIESSHCPLSTYDFFIIFENHLLPQIRLKREEEENSWKKKKVGATVDLSPEQLAAGPCRPISWRQGAIFAKFSNREVFLQFKFLKII